MWEDYGLSEDEDSDNDLAELEARLYSQYHYQDEPVIEESRTDNSIESPNLVSDGTVSELPAKSQKVPAETTQNLDGEPIEKFTCIKDTFTKAKDSKEKPRIVSNPLYWSEDSSEDEGIIAISPTSVKSDSDNSVDKITVSDEEPSRSESNKGLAKPKQQKKCRKNFFVADFGSDFSDNFVSSGSEMSDGEDSDECAEVGEHATDLKYNISKSRSESEERMSELLEVDRRPAVVPRKWSRDMNIFYSQIDQQNISITTEDMVEDCSPSSCWHLDITDRYSTTKQPNRYFFAKTRCRNCNQFGHFMRDCPDPIKEIRCYMCGAEGHREDRCPKSCCLGCGNPNHMFRSICSHCKLMERVLCKECGFYGHKRQSCPDLWRRYHSTTTTFTNNNKDKGLRPRETDSHKKRADQWCCNCGRRGHLVEECRRSRYSEYPVRPVSVQRYEAVTRLENIVSFSQKETKENLCSKTKNKKKKSRPDTSHSPPPKRRKVAKISQNNHYKQNKVENVGKDWRSRELAPPQKLSRAQRRKAKKKKELQQVQRNFKDNRPQYEYKGRGKFHEVKHWKKKKKDQQDNNKYFNQLKTSKSKKKNKIHAKF